MNTHTTIDECNNQGYILDVDDRTRIKPLKDVIESNGIEFRFFGTLNYYFRMDKLDRVLKDNRHLKKCLQRFFKCEIRTMLFNEKHTNESSNNYGGFHRHWVMEDIPESIWLNPSPQMATFMQELDEKHDSCIYFGCLTGSLPTDEMKIELIKKVIKGFHASTPNGSKGLDVRVIYNIDGLLSYCTKQRHHNIPYEYVIDTKSSNYLDDSFIRRMHSYIRQRQLTLV